MKVIDLLNKIANGEEVPKKIKYLTSIYTLRSNNNYYVENSDSSHSSGLYYQMIGGSRLNDEVEIIEEDKKIRKLDFIEENTFSKRQNGMTSEDRRLLDSNFKELGIKINEIIDYLEEKDNE